MPFALQGAIRPTTNRRGIMAFDPSTLLSRTGAGDAELRTPQNGLSLAQRKILTLLDEPQALQAFAARHGVDAERLERDLAKLVALNLVAVNGETATAMPTTVVLGGLRAPSSLMRLAFVPALIVAGAIAYFAIMPLFAPKPAPPAPLSSAAAPVVAASAAETTPVAMPTVAPIVVPLEVPAAPAAPHVTAAAPSTPAAPDPRAARVPPREVTAEPKVLPVAADTRHDEPARPVAAEETKQPASAVAQAPAPVATGSAKIATAAPTQVAVATPEKPSPPASAAPPPVVAAATAPAPHATEPPSAKPAPPVTPPTTSEPAKVALAAPSSADAHPPARAKLLPLARQDPEFPREAIVRGITNGDVKARLAIDAAGKVTGVDIVDARPARVFDRAVRDALSRWSFPAGASGRSTEVEIAFHRD
jgi:TonB family protein